MPVESWYGWFTFWSAIVILGVLLEEAPLPSKIWRFIAFARENGREKAIALVRAKWIKILETVGFIVLVIGLYGELASESKIESLNEETTHDQQEKITSLTAATAPREALPPSNDTLSHMGAWHTSAVRVQSYMFDAEAGRLAQQIVKQLNQMHIFAVDDSLTIGASAPMAFGTRVSGSNEKLVKALIDWLNASELRAVADKPPPASMMLGGKTITNTLTGQPVEPEAIIFVGAKPLPE